MGFDPFSGAAFIAAKIAEAAAAAQAAASSAVGLQGASAAAIKGTAAEGLAAGSAQAGASKAALDASIGTIAKKSALDAATGAVGTAITNPAVQQGATAAATAAASQAQKEAGDGPQVKVEGAGQANQGAAFAADRERRKRAPGRASSILTSPLGLSSKPGGAPGPQSRARSPGVAALTGGTLG